MKLAIVLLLLLPMAFAAPQKRFIVETFGLAYGALLQFVRDLLDVLGAHPTEQICEAECHKLIQAPNSSLPHTACIPLCRSYEFLINMIPDP